jgi:hypothetical protein
LPPGDLQGLAEEHLRLQGCIAVCIDENLCPQPVEPGIGGVLSVVLGLRDAASERAQGVVMAPDLSEAIDEH